MPNVTTNHGLKKPLPEEFYDVNVQNENMDAIDKALVPVASNGDNGKFLRVVGGKAAWVTVGNAEGGSF